MTGISSAVPAYQKPLQVLAEVIDFADETISPVSNDILLLPTAYSFILHNGAVSVPSDSQRALVSITFTAGAFGSTRTDSLICFARPLDSNVSTTLSIALENDTGAIIPLSFMTQHGYTRQSLPPEQISIHIDTCRFVPLEKIVLGALDEGSYTIASDAAGLLQSQLSKQTSIVRQGSTYTFDLNGTTVSYKTLLSSPVLQGAVTSETTVIVSNASWMRDVQRGDDESEQGDALIPEILAIDDCAVDHDVLHYSCVEGEAILRDVDTVSVSPKSVDLTPKMLETPVLPSCVQPSPPPKEDFDSIIWVSYSILVRLGAFSGDIVGVTVSDLDTVQRCCRIYGVDMAFADKDTAYLSPVLYLNLHLKPTSPSGISISTLPKPVSAFPTASRITISRVACRVNNDKKLLTECLRSMKQHFASRDRIVKKGDLIPVVIDEERGRMMHSLTDEGNVDHDEDEQGFETGQEAKALAWFKIEDVQAENTAKAGGIDTARVDVASTRMTQSGVTHARVIPGIRPFLGVSTPPPAPPKGVSSSYSSLYSLLSTCLHPLSSTLNLQASILLHGPKGVGKRSLVHIAAEQLGVEVLEYNAYDLVGETEVKTEGWLRVVFEKALGTVPCILLLRNLEALVRKDAQGRAEEGGVEATLRDCLEQAAEEARKLPYPVFVVATTPELDALPVPLQTLFRHHLQVESPSEKMRIAILEYMLKDVALTNDVSIRELAMQTAALNARDLKDLVARATTSALQRGHEIIKKSPGQLSEKDLVKAILPLTHDDFARALNASLTSHATTIGAPKIPSVTWDDVGGLSHVKAALYDTIQLPLTHPHLFSSGLKRRSGMLLYGPPGTGKTLVAKAVATNFSLNFLSVKGPELLNMYIGESEANVRRVFQRARDARPCVVFFDELDSVAPKRGAKGDSGGVMDRIVSQLLAEIDGMGSGSSGGDGDAGDGGVFVIGATNRPDLLDPALLRPGRFDKLLYLGVSDTTEKQLTILKALTRKFRLHPDLDLTVVAEQCPKTLTGADFYALCSDAQLKAVLRTIEAIDEKVKAINADPTKREGRKMPTSVTPQYYLDQIATPEEKDVVVQTQDFLKALGELTPSVSAQELKRYEEIRRKVEAEEKSKKKDKGKGKA
ncbi:peroxisomal assembly protein [Gaertneriomyces sp. JEL0708]|nr:peroxisomal assembly protein [Gaertneriomyces sp. JEL0708]